MTHSAVASLVETFSNSTPEFISKFYAKVGNKSVDLDKIGEIIKDGKFGLSPEELQHILVILSKTKYKFEIAGKKNEIDDKLIELLNSLSGIGINPGDPDRLTFLSELSQFSSSAQINYPDANTIIKVIAEKGNARDLLDKLNLELVSKRIDPITLAERFNTSQVLRVLEKMEDLNHDIGLGYPQKKRLYQQFNIVNHLGEKVELPINLTDPYGPKKLIKGMDDADIKLLLFQYRQLIQDPGKSEEEKNHAKLVYLALLRESMFRTTLAGSPPKGRMPHSTQIIAVLNAMNQNDHNLAEIQTGEGKSLISAMYAAILHAEGGAVDVATSNLELAKAGLAENKDFYDYIGVKTCIVTAGMDPNDYQPEGINISDVPQFALFRSRAQIEGIKLPDKVSLVLDEADYTLLDDKTQYRYAANLDPGASITNKHEWAYELINDFIDDPDSDEHPDELRKYLIKKAAGLEFPEIKIAAINDLTNKELDIWINSAISASALYPEEKNVGS